MKVELKKWTKDMSGDLIRICNNVDRQYLSDRIPDPYTEESADWWLGMVDDSEGVSGVFRAIVVDGEIAGNISVEQSSDIYRKVGEIGYLLLTDFWSKGIMTEAVRLICETAFAELDIVRINGNTFSPNVASQRVLEKSGFIKEGTRKKAVYKNNNFYDLEMYGILK